MNVIVSIGTSTNTQDNILAAKEILSAMFRKVTFSSTMKTKPVNGADNYHYINCLAMFDTSMSYHQLKLWLKERELDCGRNKEDTNEGYVTLDMDIMEYDGKRYKKEDWKRDYNRKMLAELRG
ncbi:MAG: 2-amino-4-hydroxy-6-hydroxymethyldihydropteridine diphosphokinase [Prevotella sp.]|nr:2-amino-4-hydroxy-6-hydroxymethyldihydropteridine diphosphokinase [Prevotella sp.]